MMTNLVQIAAYKALALQLMLGEADQLTRQMALPVPHPIQIQHLVSAFVGLPQYGVGGSIQTTNVAITFSEGRLHTITRIDIYPPLNMTVETVANIPATSTVSREGAYQLATQWLQAISVDVSALEKLFPPKILQQAYYASESASPGTKGRVPMARDLVRKTAVIFEITWDDRKRSELERPPVQVTILGNTKELMRLQLADRSYLRRPLIVMTNATEWGVRTNPLPLTRVETRTNRTVTPGDLAYPYWAPPRNLPEAQLPDWMAKFLGGVAAVQTLTQPERVNAYVLKKYDPMLKSEDKGRTVMRGFKSATEYPVRRGPFPVKLDLAKELGSILVDAFSYDWSWRKPFDEKHEPQYRVRLEYIRQTNVVNVVFASDNSALRLFGPAQRAPEMSFQPRKETVSKLVKQMLP